MSTAASSPSHELSGNDQSAKKGAFYDSLSCVTIHPQFLAQFVSTKMYSFPQTCTITIWKLNAHRKLINLNLSWLFQLLETQIAWSQPRQILGSSPLPSSPSSPSSSALQKEVGGGEAPEFTRARVRMHPVHQSIRHTAQFCTIYQLLLGSAKDSS